MCARRSTFAKIPRRPRHPGPPGRPRFRKLKLALWLQALLAVGIGVWFAVQPPARKDEIIRLARNKFDSQKQIDLVQFAGDLWRLYHDDSLVAATAPGDRTIVYGGIPRTPGLDLKVRVLTNSSYLVGYADALGNPVWAAYRIFDLRTRPDSPERPDRFVIDARTVARVSPGDYTGSGYDRGHLAPNHAIATRYGRDAQLETFLMSNIIPQRHALNAGLWKQLEAKIADNYPGRFGEIWVLAGPVFGQRHAATLRGGVAIPDACYMIIVDESDGRVRAEAFLFPQEAEGSLDRYLTTIDDIEQRTGLDFLHELPDEAENLLESRRAPGVW
ncbi:MAG: DNA/RNA non-specific endonuclease [Opitutaceae bacterium]|jgi:endonuclease G|nr:DNA/RNA non-specific endonuclease [Opitutaceae bacterium]